MAAQTKLRKEAYNYILNVLGSLSESSDNFDWSLRIPMEELRLLKEGLEDPSPALVALLKEMLKGAARDSTVEDHLVTPFKTCSSEQKNL